MKIVIISTCTAEKQWPDPAVLLTPEDLDSPQARAAAHRRLRPQLLPATELYTGLLHRWTTDGVQQLRRAYGEDSVDHWILSAGYGLLAETEPIAGYNVTFNTMSARKVEERSQGMGLAEAVRAATAGATLVVLALSADYLRAVGPVRAEEGQRIIAFGGKNIQRWTRDPEVLRVPATAAEAGRFRAPVVSLKGRMVQVLARALCREGEGGHQALMTATDPEQVLALMDRGGER